MYSAACCNAITYLLKDRMLRMCSCRTTKLTNVLEVYDPEKERLKRALRPPLPFNPEKAQISTGSRVFEVPDEHEGFPAGRSA